MNYNLLVQILERLELAFLKMSFPETKGLASGAEILASVCKLVESNEEVFTNSAKKGLRLILRDYHQAATRFCEDAANWKTAEAELHLDALKSLLEADTDQPQG